MSVSVLILTLNEEINLHKCLDSVRWSDDIVVFDSYSTDRTVEIAQAAGARVVLRKFDNYGAHREAARTQVEYKYPWVLAVDADETADEELADEVKKIAGLENNPHFAYRMRRKDFFMGKWIRRSTLYPSWFIRFYRPDKVRYEARSVHEYPIVEGSIGEFKGHLIHDSFNKGIGEWLFKHVRYSNFEAEENLKHIRMEKLDWKNVFNFSDPVRQRRALKEMSFRFPFRPTLRFLYMFLLRGGFLDGQAGLTYCRMLSMYEYMIVLKMKEMKRNYRET